MLQRDLIDWLFILNDQTPVRLENLVEQCRSNDIGNISWPHYLRKLGFDLNVEEWHHQKNFPEIILEQIDDSGDKIVIRNLLGMSLYQYVEPHDKIFDLKDWVKERGNGKNLLRDCVDFRYSQPRALEIGDILITGEIVISEPREGGNGAVLVHLSGGKRGTWLSFPARIAIALIDCCDCVIPAGLVKG